MAFKITLWTTISILVTIMMLTFVPAQAEQLKNLDQSIKKIEILNQNKLNLQKTIGFLIGLFAIKQIGIVSATDAVLGCCTELDNGAICQEISSTATEQCAGKFIPTRCSLTTECKSGCCIDNTEGVCVSKSIKTSCEKNNGSWVDQENCQTAECSKGCCVLGSEVDFTTELRCEFLSKANGYSKDFKSYLTGELACIALRGTIKYGACTIGENNFCKFETDIECLNQGGNFKENYLCSHPSLSSNCTKQASVNCVEGKDEIYWFDSCGNRENIYSSNLNDSWNDGKVLTKENSCGANSANINSTSCGNCNYLSGSKCVNNENAALAAGKLNCKDLGCSDEKGKYRQSGESWCVYDGYIGDGKDVVGSRHWKRTCMDGEIKTEGCADYRGQICSQTEYTSNETGDILTQAQCVINDATNCIGYNSKTNSTGLCSQNPQCNITSVAVDDFRFSVCTPKFPRGFDLTYKNSLTAAQASMICGMATQTCTVYYEKKISGWKCIANCDCEEKTFTKQMNNLCMSLGDCGAEVNILGKGTDSYTVTRAPKVSWEDYAEYATPVDGQYAQVNVSSDILDQIFGTSSGTSLAETSGILTAVNYIGQISGGVGMLAWAVPAATNYIADLVVGDLITTAGPSTSGLLTGIGTFASAVGIGMLVGTLLSYAFGLQGDAAMIMAVAGLVAGVGLGIYFAYIGVGINACWGPQIILCVIILIILIVIAAILWIFGIGDTKEKEVKFTCLPWEAPTGGDDCDKCNHDPFKPCTEYRCTSLGKVCKMLNPYSDYAECVVGYANDAREPVITFTNAGYGFNFEKVSEREYLFKTDSGECIPESYPITFSFATDKSAQCKFEINRTDNFEAMDNFFLEQNYYTTNHTGGYMMPSLSALQAVYNIPGDIREKLANTDMYIRCQDDYGNYNLNEYKLRFCVKSGPDLTPPIIIAMNPSTEKYVSTTETEKNVTIYLNEPSECRWSKEKNRSYTNMENQMDCNLDLTNPSSNGWDCTTKLTNISNNKNTFYFRCIDQPWYNESAPEKRNENTQGYEYILYKSQEELKITSIAPKGEFDLGFSPVSKDLEVWTDGGAKGDGNSICEYSFGDQNSWITFADTGKSYHRQTFSSLMGSEYLIYVRCSDIAGNEVTNSTSFKLNIDKNPPIVQRVFNNGDQIVFFTDENAKCYYSTRSCDYDPLEKTNIDSNFGKEHIIDYEISKKYYIKCEDKWNNLEPDCSLIASGTTTQ